MERVEINADVITLSNTSIKCLECQIISNTGVNTINTGMDSIINVLWYRGQDTLKELISNNEQEVFRSILPTVSNSNVSFNSTLIFNPVTSSTPISTLGNYTCVAWIGEQSVRNKTSNNVQVMMKRKTYNALMLFFVYS